MSNEAMDRVLSKIKKLLARADESRNDNEHERAIAMRQANSLLARHGLSMEDLGEVEAQNAFGNLGELFIKTGRVDGWVRSVYNTLAKLNGCYMFTTNKDGGGVKMVGRAMRVTVARSMADYVLKSIIREAEERRKTSHLHGRQFTKDFGDGAARGLWEQVSEILRRMKEGELDGEKISSSHALVVVNQHALAIKEASDLVKSKYKLNFKAAGPSRKNDAFDQGRSFGQNVSLNAQLGGDGQGRIGN